jgi:hypothetical protein
VRAVEENNNNKKKKKENVFYSPKQEQPVTNKHFNKRGDVAYCKGV